MNRSGDVRTILAACCAATLGVLAVGCAEPTLSEEGWFSCPADRPDCPEGFECIGGRCLPAGTRVDGRVDAPTTDAAVPDAVQPDAKVPDAVQPDAKVSDAAQPDAKVPDAAQPDAKVPDAKVPDATATDAAQPCVHPTVTKSCTGGFCTIPAGCYLRGSPAGEPCRLALNEGQHQVTLTHAFELQEKEVTQGQFNTLMGYNPSKQKCTSCPVESVSWNEAAYYCNKLSDQKSLTNCYTCTGTLPFVTCSEATAYSGKKVYLCPGYRLPTSAEWEYAYRAGATTAYYNGANSATTCKCTPQDAKANAIGWYCSNSSNTLQTVGQKLANGWGLLDMAGNVGEHCQDYYQEKLGSVPLTDPVAPNVSTSRSFRGGGFNQEAWTLRAAYRGSAASGGRWNFIGFRCARTK